MDNLNNAYFIKNIKKAVVNDELDKFCLNELTTMRRNEKTDLENEEVDIFKKLCIVYFKYDVEAIEFVKYLASNNVIVQKYACHGLMLLKNNKIPVLLHSIMIKNIKNGKNFLEQLNLVCHYSKKQFDFGPFLDEIVNLNNEFVENQINRHQGKFLLAKSIYSDSNNLINIVQSDKKLLFIKLQLILINNKKLSENDFLFILSQLYAEENIFTLVKMLEVIYKNMKETEIFMEILKEDKRFICFLKESIIKQNERKMKQIYLSLSFISCAILKLLNNFTDEAEVFVYRMLNSENDNSKISGMNFCYKHNVLIDLLIKQCIVFYKKLSYARTTLFNLVSEENSTNIYMKTEEFASEELLLQIYKKSTDPLLHHKILFEHPEIFQQLPKKLTTNISIDDMVAASENILHFDIIYNNAQHLSNNEIAALIENHIEIVLIKNIKENTNLITNLFIFACKHGDIEMNRHILLKYVTDINNIVLIPNILLFNMVLNEKYAYINNQLIPYYSNNKYIKIENIDGVYDGVLKISPGENNIYEIENKNTEGILIKKNNQMVKIMK